MLLLPVHGLVDAVRAKDDDITRLQDDLLLLVAALGQQAQRHARHRDAFRLVPPHQPGVGKAGIGYGESPAGTVIDGEDQRDIAVVNARLAQVLVHLLQHLSRLAGVLHYMPAHDAHRQRPVERRRGGFPGHVADNDCYTPFAVGEKVVDVAAQLAGRFVGEGDVQPRHARRGVGQQAFLNLARGGQVALQALLVPAHGFVEPGVFESDGDVGSQGGEHLLVLLGEGVVLGAFQVQHAHQAVFENKRYHQLRTNLYLVTAADVARVQVHVGDAQRLAQRRRRPADAVAEGDSALLVNALVMAQSEGVLQELRLLVPKHD